MSDNIKVVVKVRPLISREIEERAQVLWRVCENTIAQIDSTSTVYTFDKVYDTATETQVVYDDIAQPIVEAAISGINGTIFAYGQTSSGKTYTMMGDENSLGIIPLAIYDIFDKIKSKTNRDFLLRVSYIEIYNEQIKDLLDVTKQKIKIHENLDGAVKVDATERVTSTPEEVLQTMREGDVNRQVGATNMNDKSSRSHTIFQITIESREHTENAEEEPGCVNVSQLNLVDLAGSERAGQTGATGTRFKEGTMINKSLSSLGLVIKQLSEDPKRFVNYRDSKLTRILQNSLGGNAKTSIICAVTPATVEETISTLQFANRAKAIQNKPEVNAVATNATMLQSLTKKLANLQYELDSKKHLEHHNEVLLQKIKELQRQILFGMTQTKERVNRRKTWCAPRRATMCSLMPSIREEGLMPSHSFCTPGISTKPKEPESEPQWVTMRRTSDIPELEEETTPPSRRKKIPYTGEIINLDDSDDDNDNTNMAPCSPYHKCYETSKTPPCILRDKAKKAEHDYNDLLEMTEREKMYSPNTVELLNRLDNTSKELMSTKEELEELKKHCIKKDEEIQDLKGKVVEYENIVKENLDQKIYFEKEVQEYETRVTDLEVCLENCKQKAKQREVELLSLFNEKNSLSSQDKSRALDKAESNELSVYLNLSRDISLVGSDCDSSILPINAEKRSNEEEITCLQRQIHEKNDLIRELTKKLTNSQQNVKMFCEELQTSNNSKSALESTFNKFNQTILDLNVKLEKANNEVKKYETIILELQNQFNDRETEVGEKLIHNNKELSNLLIELKDAKEIKLNHKREMPAIELNPSDFTKDLHLEIETKAKDIDTLKKANQLLDEECLKNKELIDKYSHQLTVLMEENHRHLLEMQTLNSEKEQTSKEMEKLRTHVNNLQKKICEKDECIQKLSDNIKTHTKHIDQNINENTCLSMQIELLKGKIKHLSENITLSEFTRLEVEDLKKELNQKNDDLKKLDGILKMTLQENENLKDNLQKIRNDCDEMQSLLSNKLETIENLKQSIDERENLLKESIHVSSFNELKSQNETLKSVILNKDGIIEEMVQNMFDIQNNLDIKEKELCDVKQKWESCTNEMNRLTREMKEVSILRLDRKKLEECIAAKDCEMNALQSQVTNLIQQIHDFNEKIKVLENLKFEMENNESQQKIIYSKIKSIYELIANENQSIYENFSNVVFIVSEIENWVTAQHAKNEKTATNLTNAKEESLHLSNVIKCYNPLKLIEICTNVLNEDNVVKINNDFVKNYNDLKNDLSNMDELQSQVINYRENILIHYLENCNNKLKQENVQIKDEIHCLVELANELNKHISKHRTQLSTLTATMYAENKLLKTKFRALQHHHNRLHGVCKREVPELRRQLRELHGLLSTEMNLNVFPQNIIENDCDSTIKAQTNESHFSEMNEISKYSMSTLDTESLMLGNNFTLGPSANSTMINCDTEPALKLNTIFENLDLSVPKVQNNTNQLLNAEIQNDQDTSHVTKVNRNSSCCNKSTGEVSLTAIIESKSLNSDQFLLCELQNHSENCILKKYINIIWEELLNTINCKENLAVKMEAFQVECNDLKIELKSHEAGHQDFEKIKSLEKMLEELKQKNFKIQAENDELSNDIMDLVHDNDSLKNKLDSIQIKNINQELNCLECVKKDEVISNFKKNQIIRDNVLKESNVNICDVPHDKSLTKKNIHTEKICSLQSELQASQEDCKKITEEVSIIKDHLYRSDDSLSMQENLTTSSNADNSNCLLDTCPQTSYMKRSCLNVESDKQKCLDFLINKHIYNEQSLLNDKSLFEIMKHLYDTLFLKHSNELENLLNKLKQFDEDKSKLQEEIRTLAQNYQDTQEMLKIELEHRREAEKSLCHVTDIIKSLELELSLVTSINDEDFKEKITMINETFLEPLEKVIDVSLSETFGNFIQHLHKYSKRQLITSQNRCYHLENKIAETQSECNAIEKKWESLNEEFVKNTTELELLKKHKEALTEINRVVTLHLVAGEEKLKQIVTEHTQGKDHIVEAISSLDTMEQLSFILHSKDSLIIESDKTVDYLNKRNIALEQRIKEITLIIQEKEVSLQILQSENYDLKENMREQSDLLKKNENLFEAELSSLKNKLEGLEKSENEKNKQLKCLILEAEKLKSLNEILTEENKSLNIQLDNGAVKIIEQKKNLDEIEEHFKKLKKTNESLTHDLRDLRELCAKQTEQIAQIDVVIDERNEQLVKLEKNVATHQKATEVLASKCNRLQQEKEELQAALTEKFSTIEQLTATNSGLQLELDNLRSLKTTIKKQLCESRSTGEGSCRSSRNSLEDSRRRRQSAYDAHRPIADIDENREDEAEQICSGFSSVMQTEGNTSIRHVTERKKKRQDNHDLHRTSNLQDMMLVSEENLVLINENKVLREQISNLKSSIQSGHSSSDYYQKELENTRSELLRCQEIYQDLEKKYKEVDEECDMCAQNLRHMEIQCIKLNKDKNDLTKQLNEMRARFGAGDAETNTVTKRDQAVNTDKENCAPTSSSTVDRTSYNSEVEKRKSLARRVVELEKTNRTLLAALETLRKNAPPHTDDPTREVASLRAELESCRSIHRDLQEQYLQLSEEHSTCKHNARQRDTEYAKLQLLKNALEEKVTELQNSSSTSCELNNALRRRRQSLHDSNRPIMTQDASTNTDGGAVSALGVDWMTHDAEREKRRKLQRAYDQLRAKNSDLAAQLRRMQLCRQEEESTVGMLQTTDKDASTINLEVQQLRSQIEMLTCKNQQLEQHIQSLAPAAFAALPPPTLLVSTGSAIVRNQQLGDLMKENHNLKKVNAKLIKLCQKRSKPVTESEN